MSLRIGDIAIAKSTMAPSGKIIVAGMTYDARADGECIEAGSRCMIIRGDPTGLVVRKVDESRPTLQLSGHGQLIHKAESQRNTDEVNQPNDVRDPVERQLVLDNLKKGCMGAAVLGSTIGLLGFVSAAILGILDFEDSNHSMKLFAIAFFGTACWGVITYLLLGCLPTYLLSRHYRAENFTSDFISVVLSLAGATIGFWWSYQPEMMAFSLGWTVAGTVVFGVIGWIIAICCWN